MGPRGTADVDGNGQLKQFFPNLWFGLLVGVVVGLPELTGLSSNDIRLGDIIVVLPEGESAVDGSAWSRLKAEMTL